MAAAGRQVVYFPYCTAVSDQAVENLAGNAERRFVDGLMGGSFSMMLELVLPSAAEEGRRMLGEFGAQLGEGAPWRAVLLSCRTPEAPAGQMMRLLPDLAGCSFPLPLIFSCSGYGQTGCEALGFARQMLAGGHRMALAVSGDLRSAGKETHCMDSVEILEQFAAAGDRVCSGAVVNPAQYHHLDSALVYGKLEKKLAAGARFIVSSVLWDMKKAQELQWYMRSRDYAVPVFAEMEYCSEETLEYYLHGEVHRALMAGSMLRQMRTDLKDSREHFAEEQLRRLARQAVGYRLLGYSGILLRGLDSARLRTDFVRHYREAENRLGDYGSWRREWTADECVLALPPLHTVEYLYSGLLEPGCQYESADELRTPRFVGAMPQARRTDRLISGLRRLADHARVPQFVRRALGMTPANIDGLRKTAYIGSRLCPKGLQCGACGGLQPGGLCEDGRRQCLFRRIQPLQEQ